MLLELPHQLTDWGMMANLVSEGVGIVLTVWVIEARSERSEHRRRLPGRKFVVNSLGSRLDRVAADWAWVLSALSSVNTGHGLDDLEEAFRRTEERHAALLRRLQRSEPADKTMVAPGTTSGDEGVNSDILAGVTQVVRGLREILESLDSSVAVMSPDMVDHVNKLRADVAKNLEGVSGLEQLLLNAPKGQETRRYGAAISALVARTRYLDHLENLWKAIPGQSDPFAKPSLLDHLSAETTQLDILHTFYERRYPEISTKVRIAAAGGDLGSLFQAKPVQENH